MTSKNIILSIYASYDFLSPTCCLQNKFGDVGGMAIFFYLKKKHQASHVDILGLFLGDRRKATAQNGPSSSS